MIKSRVLIFLFLTCGAWCADPLSKRFDQETFRSAKLGNIVCFDLRDESHLKAGIFLKYRGDEKSPQSHYVVLPFPAKAVDVVRDPVTTWGSYGHSTMIAYIVPRNQSSMLTLGIDPILQLEPNSDHCDEATADTVCLAGTNSLVHEFSYPFYSRETDWANALDGLDLARLDAIAVALPSGSRGMDIRDNRSAIPGPIPDTGNDSVSYYPTFDATVHQLRIRYEVPPTEAQKEIVDVGAKLIGGTLTPLLEMGFLAISDPKKRSARRKVLIAGIVVQICLLVAVSVVAYKIHNEMSTKAIGDIGAALAGCAASAVLLRFKGGTISDAPSAAPRQA
jgi:hypothetical protein